MVSLGFHIYDKMNGRVLLDCAGRASGTVFATGEHGFEWLRSNIALTEDEAFRIFDRGGMPHVYLGSGPFVAYDGRLDGVGMIQGGISLNSLGYWNALTDSQYGQLWSDKSYRIWYKLNSDDIATAIQEAFVMDKNNRLFITSRENQTYTSSDRGYWAYETVSVSGQDVAEITFTYDLTATADWTARMSSFDSTWGSETVEWTLTGNGATQSATTTVTLTAPETNIAFYLYAPSGVTESADTGTNFLEITAVRVKGTTSTSVYLDEIVSSYVTALNTLNPTQISGETGMIESPALDLTDFRHEPGETTPGRLFAEVAALGDDQTPPRRWEIGVWEKQRVHLRPRGDQGLDWFVDVVGPLDVIRTTEGLYNAAFAVYRNERGLVRRTDASSESLLVDVYGLTRRGFVRVQTTSDTLAQTHRDAFLDDHKNITPQATLVTRGLFDRGGASYPLWMARSGDSVTIRNLPVTGGQGVDKIRRFRLKGTEYDVDSNTLALTPEEEFPSLTVLVARNERQGR